MFFIVLFLCTFLIGCPRLEYTHIQDKCVGINKDDSISVSLYQNSRSVIDIEDSIHFLNFGKTLSESFENFSDNYFYRLETKDSLCEVILINSTADSVAIYKKGNLYKSIKFVFLDRSIDLVSAVVCDSSNNCKISKVTHLKNDIYIDLRKSL